MARTAVVAGTATAVSGSVQRHAANKQQAEADQQQDMADQSAQATDQMQAQAPPAGSDRLTQLKQLGDLKASGVLTDAEFEAEKARILAS